MTQSPKGTFRMTANDAGWPADGPLRPEAGPWRDSSWALQQAIYTALTGDSTLMAMITGVHDHVPQETAFPYVTIGESTARDWRTVGRKGAEATLILHAWSRSRGRKQAKQISPKSSASSTTRISRYRATCWCGCASNLRKRSFTMTV